jgi:hypothetical protein
MRPLSTILQLVCGKLKSDELHLQRSIRGVDYDQFRGVHTVRFRNIQGVSGISLMQPMQPTNVFNSWGIDMPRLFARLLVANGEFNLHLQCGLLGA